MCLNYYGGKFKFEVKLAEEATLSAFQFPVRLIAMKYKMLKYVTVRSIMLIRWMCQQHANTITIFLTGWKSDKLIEKLIRIEVAI